MHGYPLLERCMHGPICELSNADCRETIDSDIHKSTLLDDVLAGEYTATIKVLYLN